MKEKRAAPVIADTWSSRREGERAAAAADAAWCCRRTMEDERELDLAAC